MSAIATMAGNQGIVFMLFGILDLKHNEREKN